MRLSPSSHPEPLACESTPAGCLVSLAPSGAFEFRDVPSGRYLLVGFPLRSHAASLAGRQLAGVGDRARGAARERGRRLGGAGTRLRRGGLHAARTRAGRDAAACRWRVCACERQRTRGRVLRRTGILPRERHGGARVYDRRSDEERVSHRRRTVALSSLTIASRRSREWSCRRW